MEKKQENTGHPNNSYESHKVAAKTGAHPKKQTSTKQDKKGKDNKPTTTYTY